VAIKKLFYKGISGISVGLMLSACGGGSQTSDPDPSASSITLPVNVRDALLAPMSSLTQELNDSIAYMYSEEKLAKELYLNIYEHQSVIQLKNIATNSEVKHTEAVNQLAAKYDLNITKYPDTEPPYLLADIEKYGSGVYPVEPIQELYDNLYDKGIASQKNALEVGCIVEVTDINDLDAYIVQAEASSATDVLEIFEWLRNGSYKHYWAFDKGLKDMNIVEGCCSIGELEGVNYCHPEYPKN